MFEISAATNKSSFGAPTTSLSLQVIQAGAGDYTETPQHFVDHIVDPILLGVSDGSHRDPRPHKCTVPRCSKAYVRRTGLNNHIRLNHGPKPAHTIEHGDPQDSQQADPLHGSQRSENDSFQDP